MSCFWKAWTTATTPEKALGVGRRLLDALGVADAELQVVPYPKTDGHVLSFVVNTSDQAWAETVYAVLSAAQAVGRAWQVLGSIEDELEILSNEPSVGGLTMLTCSVTRPANSRTPR
jgi:hypothetical protein